MTKVLVTGGCGFLGSHVVDLLISQGHEVNVLDLVSISPWSNEKAQYFVGDITNSDFVNTAMMGCDYVIHLAAWISAEESQVKASEYMRNNVHGSSVVFEACVKNNIKKVVFASSCAVYGDGKYFNYDKGYYYPNINKGDIIGTREKSSENDATFCKSVYAFTKICNEQMANSYLSQNSILWSALRFTNIFGPRQLNNSQYSGLISKIFNYALKNKELEIYGNGVQLRNFIYVMDAARAVILAMTASRQGIYNIGSLDSINVLDVVNLSRQILQEDHRDLKYNITNHQIPGDVLHSVVDTRLALMDLNFSCNINFTTALSNTYAYLAH